MRGTAVSKWLLMPFACMTMLLACLVTPAIAETDDTLVVGVPTNRCPIFYPDSDTGEPTGIGIDLMSAVIAKAGYDDVRFRFIEEETNKDALDNPQYDLIMPFGTPIDSAAGKPTIVSDSLMQTPFTLVIDDKRQKLPPLGNLKVGMLRSYGGVAESIRESYPGLDIVFYDTMDESVHDLRANKVDALLNNSYVWSYVLQKPAYSDLSVQPTAIVSMEFCVGTTDTPKGRKVIARINDGISQLEGTRRQAIILDYTARRLYQYDFADYAHQYGLVVVLVGALFAAVIVIAVQKQHNLHMRHEKTVRDILDRDLLTGALSLRGFKERVSELLHDHPDIPYFLSYTNIRDFKYVNDTLGRDAGDDLLCFGVSKIQAALSDVEAVGRVDGDHFAILRRVGGEAKIVQDDAQVVEAVRNYFVDRGKGQRLQICAGIYVLTPADYHDPNVDQMIDFARAAEKRVRDVRNDGYEFYNPEQWEQGKRTAEIVGHLPVAIKDGELMVWYQPQVCYTTGDITGAEALCRWNHASLGWISPGEFIPILETAGLIYELDQFIWRQVCADLRQRNEQGMHRFVSVNVSRYDIQANKNLPGYLYQLVREYGLSPDQLRIEITETAYVENPELLIRTTTELHEFGFQVEMDDFGSGYSSLSMIKEVPVDRIKLDLRFLGGAGDPERGRIIVSCIIQMVKQLGMSLIAEGVENSVQASFLHEQGCDEMQGFFFYKPMSIDEFDKID